MPDLGNIEGDVDKEATSHPQQLDSAIGKADQAVDKEDGGADHGLADKASEEAEQKLGGQQPPS